jgi:hypothetical protein
MGLMADGVKNLDIAKLLGISRKTLQGELISTCPIIVRPLISSSEQPYDSPRKRPVVFTEEENHVYFATADSQVLTPPQRSTDQPL